MHYPGTLLAGLILLTGWQVVSGVSLEKVPIRKRSPQYTTVDVSHQQIPYQPVYAPVPSLGSDISVSVDRYPGYTGYADYPGYATGGYPYDYGYDYAYTAYGSRRPDIIYKRAPGAQLEINIGQNPPPMTGEMYMEEETVMQPDNAYIPGQAPVSFVPVR